IRGSALCRLQRAEKSHDPFPCNTKQHAGNPAARKVAANFPKPVAQRTAQRHADRPSILHTHEVLPDRVPVSFVQSAQPIPHHLSPGAGAVEDDGDFAGAPGHLPSPYIIHGPYNVHGRNFSFASEPGGITQGTSSMPRYL